MQLYSVLLAVYKKEKPEHLEAAIESMINQTVTPDEIVIVCDGALTGELDYIIEKFAREYPDIFNIVRLESNVGIGLANNEGLKHCRNELIAKMDSDDISVPERCELQLERFEQNPELAVVGGYIEEFDSDPNDPFDIRDVPLENKEIRFYAKRRQPFNNMTVMYRKSVILGVGGYKALRRAEDYDLYIRILNRGYYTENIPKVLVKARVNLDAKNRRASLPTLKGMVVSRWSAFRLGYSSLFDFLICVLAQLVIFVCPVKIQNLLYNRFLRKPVEIAESAAEHELDLPQNSNMAR